MHRAVIPFVGESRVSLWGFLGESWPHTHLCGSVVGTGRDWRKSHCAVHQDWRVEGLSLLTVLGQKGRYLHQGTREREREREREGETGRRRTEGGHTHTHTHTHVHTRRETHTQGETGRRQAEGGHTNTHTHTHTHIHTHTHTHTDTHTHAHTHT